MIGEMSKANAGRVDFDRIERNLRNTKPRAADDIPHLLKFYHKWGGGQHAFYIKELCDFACSCVPSGRSISGPFFSSLAKIDVTPEDMKVTAQVVCATLKAQAACPADKVVSRVCRFITQQDLQTLSGKRLHAMTAAGVLLTECREFAQKAGLRAGQHQIALLGKLDCSVARHLFKKPQDVEHEFITGYASDFAEAVLRVQRLYIADHGISLENPWAIADPISNIDQSTVGERLVEYDESGAPVAAGRHVVNMHGFYEGDVVVKKDGGDCPRKITLISEDAVCHNIYLLFVHSPPTPSLPALNSFTDMYCISSVYV